MLLKHPVTALKMRLWFLSVGDDVEAKFTGVDRKNRAISLSVRAKDEADEKDAIATVNKQEDANFSNNAMAEAFKAAKGE
ncbi:30S ribosomal protein S1 [Salmonella enterica subsp. enterica]|uniref:30S ribosomal protein S1 n=1 Tax=Salmonella enterica I TaxID=59201 RepID=A0A447U677_SALET|nr:30S ribosomal protein S1 [Salmonella enterica subsp. enterica]